jgi:hypothetical protein
MLPRSIRYLWHAWDATLVRKKLFNQVACRPLHHAKLHVTKAKFDPDDAYMRIADALGRYFSSQRDPRAGPALQASLTIADRSAYRRS